MKKIVPFSQDIIFNTNLAEITSVSLEHTLGVSEDHVITGEFVISGTYKMVDTSINTEPFHYNLPFDIHLDEKYDLRNVVVDIDDFYYEIINNSILSVHIEVLIDRLIEIKPEETQEVTSETTNEEMASEMINQEMITKTINQEVENVTTTVSLLRKIEVEEPVITTNVLNRNEGFDMQEPVVHVEAVEQIVKKENKEGRSLFDHFDTSLETYTTYKVCIVREGDNVESILEKYNISKEELESYNDMTEIKIGDKLIIPAMR